MPWRRRKRSHEADHSENLPHLDKIVDQRGDEEIIQLDVLVLDDVVQGTLGTVITD